MGLIEMEIEKLLETNPAEWLAYKMVLPQMPETGGDAMEIVKKYTGMAIESATKSLKAENKRLKAKNKELQQGIINDRDDVVLVPKKIYDQLENLKFENKRLVSFLQDALPHIECMTNSQSSLITAISEYLQALEGNNEKD